MYPTAIKKKLRLTDWDDQVRLVHLQGGHSIAGFRLRPGLSICADDLAHIDVNDGELDGFTETQLMQQQDTIELVDALSVSGVTLRQVAKQSGVSSRTLQRRFKTLGFPKPEYWMLLSRIRNASILLAGNDPLAAVADGAGFSDQDHMTRECRRWFGCTPKQLKADKTLQKEINQPGLGNWTVEQSSIK